MIDTHAHIYDEAFDADGAAMVARARNAGVTRVVLPNIDAASLPRMLDWERQYPRFCYAAIGLHPTSVGANYREELAVMRRELERRSYIAIGEIGTDLYWDKTFCNEQVAAFQTQVEWAIEYRLPIIVHVRNSHAQTIAALRPYRNSGLRGVFHCFSGNEREAAAIFEAGDFSLGIGGVVTFKNAGVATHLKNIPIEKLVLETDSPYLTPAPHRGKRNEPAYVALVCEKLAEIYERSPDEISRITTENAERLFFREMPSRA